MQSNVFFAHLFALFKGRGCSIAIRQKFNLVTVNDLMNARGVYLISEVQAGAFNR